MLEKDTQRMYSAFKAKDPRFDGHFFVGISSTGIYCRPVCRARQPKIENCNFFATAAEAEQAGYRPCLLCRPELAPGKSITDSSKVLAKNALRAIEENCHSGESMDEIAKSLGYTSRHLHRVFKSEYNVSPVQYIQTCRLLLAKSLLTDTNLSVFDVAMSAGFGSLRRFNDLFKKQYGLSPTSLRKKIPEEKKLNREVKVSLGYRPPYLFEDILSFLALRAIPGVEAVEDGKYMRTVSLQDKNQKEIYGWIKVENIPQKNFITLTVSENLLPVLPKVLSRVRKMFDLYCDPSAVYEAIKNMNDIRPGLSKLGTRLPGSFDPFEMAVRAILGQQITVKAAGTLASRLVKAYGTPIDTGCEGLTHIFPSPERLIALDGPIENYLGPLGIIASRAKTILALAKVFSREEIDFEYSSNIEEEIKKLMEIPGIGSWTAGYIGMRAMGWTDVFLETDAGIKKALAPYTKTEMLQLGEAWRPWRSYATINLWNSL